jgi:hypothetical protein
LPAQGHARSGSAPTLRGPRVRWIGSGRASTPGALRTLGRTARRRMRNRVGRLPRPPPCTRAARRSRCERSSDHGVEKPASAHPRRRFKRKNGGFCRARFVPKWRTRNDSNVRSQIRRLQVGTGHSRRRTMLQTPTSSAGAGRTVCWAYHHASNLRHPLGVDEPLKGDKSAKRVPQSVPISFI